MANDKTELRKEIKQNLSACSTIQLDADSKVIADKLFALNEFNDSQVVMVFISIKGEVNTSFIIDYCFEQGKTVVVPKVDLDKKTMDAVRLDGQDHILAKTKYGILEPVNAESHPVEKIDLIITPGLAFDDNLNRLGRGGGYYDKFLSQKECVAVKCGVAYDLQIVTDLPIDEQDQKISILVTEKRVIR